MAYDKWGDDGTEWLETNSDLVTNGAMRIFFTYAIYASITFLITITSSETNARSIALAVLGVMSGIEGIQLRLNLVHQTCCYRGILYRNDALQQ